MSRGDKGVKDTRLIEMCSDVEVFRTSEGETYARFRVQESEEDIGHWEVLRCYP